VAAKRKRKKRETTKMPSMKTPHAKRKKNKSRTMDHKSDKSLDDCLEKKIILDDSLEKKYFRSTKPKSSSKWKSIMIVATVLVGLIAIIGILWYRHIETKHYNQIELRRLKHNEEMERIALEKKKESMLTCAKTKYAKF